MLRIHQSVTLGMSCREATKTCDQYLLPGMKLEEKASESFEGLVVRGPQELGRSDWMLLVDFNEEHHVGRIRVTTHKGVPSDAPREKHEKLANVLRPAIMPDL